VEILCLIILIRATINRDLTTISGDREFVGTIITVTIVIIISIIGIHIFSDFPQLGESVMDRFSEAPSQTYVALGLEKTGAANIVTSILLDFRAYDTLGEATVLFCAILGALALLRKKARKALDEKEQAED
jgi:multisubunit Na+/H+ antiporter MnhB subunit